MRYVLVCYHVNQSKLQNKQSDVIPSLIMSRVESASGAKYSAHNEQPRKMEKIAPVGTNYTPIGRPDIDSLRKGTRPGGESAPKPVVQPAPKPTLPGVSRPTYGIPPTASSRDIPSGKAPPDAWSDTPQQPPPPPVVASTRPVPSVSHFNYVKSFEYDTWDFRWRQHALLPPLGLLR